MFAAWAVARTTSEVSRATLQPGAHVRIFSLWRTLSVRILTDVNVGSEAYCADIDVCKNPNRPRSLQRK